MNHMLHCRKRFDQGVISNHRVALTCRRRWHCQAGLVWCGSIPGRHYGRTAVYGGPQVVNLLLAFTQVRLNSKGKTRINQCVTNQRGWNDVCQAKEEETLKTSARDIGSNWHRHYYYTALCEVQVEGPMPTCHFYLHPLYAIALQPLVLVL